MIVDITPVNRLDWDSPGARLYQVPFTHDGTWGRTRVPLYVACGPRPGATVVAIGGTHGDEYEGPVGLKNLIQRLDPTTLVAGRLIVIPVLNVPAFQAAQRQSPLDGKNMNRVFPGDARGTITERIARFIQDEVFPRADVVIDIHAAGADFEIAPCTSFHALADADLFAATRRAAFLFGMPFAWVYTSGMGTGLLTEAAEALGKVTIGGEFGHGAAVDRQGVHWAHHGVLNVMRQYGVLPGPLEDLTPPGLDRQRLVWATDIDRWITAPCGGICEPLAPLGALVRPGQPVARIHDFDRVDEPGLDIVADQEGYVLVRHFRAVIKPGAVVMVIGQERET
jgi:predicted deacylase